jgi:hypothetical protein
MLGLQPVSAEVSHINFLNPDHTVKQDDYVLNKSNQAWFYNVNTELTIFDEKQTFRLLSLEIFDKSGNSVYSASVFTDIDHQIAHFDINKVYWREWAPGNYTIKVSYSGHMWHVYPPAQATKRLIVVK